MIPEGFNPLRWKCDKDGCFNEKRRPKIEVFADCFPRRINFGDVDGLVEIDGRFCLLEWKGKGGSVGKGQQMSFVAFTKIPGNVVFVVDGDADTMEVRRYCLFWEGKQQAYVDGNLEAVKGRIRKWVNWTQLGVAA